MNDSENALDAFAAGFARIVTKLWFLVIPLAIAATFFVAREASNLEFSNNFRVFFSQENPELQAFEELQATYTKTDNILFILKSKSGQDAFNASTLSAVEILTDESWLIPYALRVDSLRNYQHTYAFEDDLVVEDLFEGGADLSAADIERIRDIAYSEPLLRGALISEDGAATAVSVTLQFPEQSLDEVPEAVAAARALRDQIETDYPDLEVLLTGTSMLNNAFSEAVNNDLATLIPLMIVVVLIFTIVTIRSFWATFATLILIICSGAVGMGFAGFVGFQLAGPAPMAPVVILTLAIADSIHILISMRQAMADGLEKRQAIIESARINFLPVLVTSITTIIGFMSLNFSDSPPYRAFGTITAVGIFAAWFFSITLLPALLQMLPVKFGGATARADKPTMMFRLANFTIARARILVVLLGLFSAALIVNIPKIELSDRFQEYFAPRIEFRADSDKALELFGYYPLDFSVPGQDAGGISDPEYLRDLEKFADWLRSRDIVTHVYSYTDIIKRLNKNMNNDNPEFYAIPDSRELAAQYLLLYELSLPYGLDLNDRVNIDKSATRVTATLYGDTETAQVRAFIKEIDAWFEANAPALKAPPTGAQIMFTFIAQRNVETMILGTSVAIVAIAVIMIIALRSVGLGILSIVPNALPILVAFGIWALLIGEVGLSVSTIAAISLGIVIDDTVHFLTKYARARKEKGLSTDDSVRYAFETVGVAIIVNTIILAAGFLIVTLSAFKINMEMGQLTTMTIGLALILDFLFLPALLIALAKGRGETIDEKGNDYVQHTFTA